MSEHEHKEAADDLGPLVGPEYTYSSVGDKVASIALGGRHPLPWFVVLGIAGMLVGLLFFCITYLIAKGVGLWGINVPVGWGFAIINFVWWIGIGHAGTLISAILFLFKQDWRTSINRFAEAMTLFAVGCAGMYPLLHLGRPWLFYWIMPYPNTLKMWPQFRSPLVWDVFAISTYALVSLLFWYTGLIPDLASMRDKAKNKVQKVIYGLFAMGWRGSARHWHRYEIAYLLLAGLSTPLVLSVHSVVSLDFAVSVLPGWHATIFPPYFVAGAVFSGFGMVCTLMIPIRKIYGLENIITKRHLNNMAKIMLATGMMVVYGYSMEVFYAYYSGNEYEQFMMANRMGGPYGIFYGALIFCNGLSIQLLWFKKVRTNPLFLWILAIIVNIGMWLERFVIVVTSIHRDFLPSSWDMFVPTGWDWALYIGTIGFFLFAIVLFVRWVPIVSMFEMKELIHKTKNPDH